MRDKMFKNDSKPPAFFSWTNRSHLLILVAVAGATAVIGELMGTGLEDLESTVLIGIVTLLVGAVVAQTSWHLTSFWICAGGFGTMFIGPILELIFSQPLWTLPMFVLPFLVTLVGVIWKNELLRKVGHGIYTIACAIFCQIAAVVLIEIIGEKDMMFILFFYSIIVACIIAIIINIVSYHIIVNIIDPKINSSSVKPQLL